MNRSATELSLLHQRPAQTLVLDVSDLDCRREAQAFVDRTVAGE